MTDFWHVPDTYWAGYAKCWEKLKGALNLMFSAGHAECWEKLKEALNLMFSICLQPLPVFTFANQAGLDMLETTFLTLQDIPLDKIFDESGQKLLCSEFTKIMQQVMQNLPSNFLFNIYATYAWLQYWKFQSWETVQARSSFVCDLHSNMSTSFISCK